MTPLNRSTDRRRLRAPRFLARYVHVSWHDLAITVLPILVVCALAVWATIRLVQPAPPNTITMTVGPAGSSFWVTAEKYRTILARNGVKVILLPSDGSLDNLRKLNDPSFDVDIGFVQGGVATPNTQTAASAPVAASGPDLSASKLMSLGSMFYVPVVVFYRGTPITRLSELRGKNIAVGGVGSGTRQLALTLLKANGIEPGDASHTNFDTLSGEDAAQALEAGKIDAAFLTGDSATGKTMARLVRANGVRLFDFEQADAYVRRFGYLNSLELPMGVFDLGKNMPDHPIHLVAPTVELVARESLHPALSDLLIEAAREVHGRANLLQQANMFPAPIAHDFRISDDASRYYKSGKSFLYRSLPFWLASLMDRILVIIVPLIVVLVPGIRFVPSLYGWRVRSRIYRWYGSLISIERGALGDADERERDALLAQLDDIEASVNRMKMPLAYADQFYVLREHIGFVRQRLAQMDAARASPDAAPASLSADPP
jgi:TRAP-type uncharacterized transport system substrate-binding protein